MENWDNLVWTLEGSYPVGLRRKAPLRELSILVVQRGHQLATNVVSDRVVSVNYLDSTGLLLRELGEFEVQDEAGRTIQRDLTLDGVRCCLELTITSFERRGPLLTGIICPLKDDAGGDEGVVGGFSAEVQGGALGGRKR